MGWIPWEDGGKNWSYGATAKEYLEPPEAGRDKEVPPLEPSEGAQLCPYLELGLLVFWAVREQMSVV